MAVRSALRAGPLNPPPQVRFLVPIIWLKGLGKLKVIQRPHRESTPRPSGLQYSASSNYATAYCVEVKHAQCGTVIQVQVIIITQAKSLTAMYRNDRRIMEPMGAYR
jgi:hypothetical protein